jgi:hypothetical protein
MHLNDNLVDVFEVVEGESFEPLPLAALAVDLQCYVLLGEVVALEDVLQRIKSMVGSPLSNLAHAGKIEEVGVTVRRAGRLHRVCAVVLVVDHRVFGSDLATETIEPIDSYVDESLRMLEKIFADKVAAVL